MCKGAVARKLIVIYSYPITNILECFSIEGCLNLKRFKKVKPVAENTARKVNSINPQAKSLISCLQYITNISRSRKPIKNIRARGRVLWYVIEMNWESITNILPESLQLGI